MMTLPFFGLFGGLVLAWAGRRSLAILLWVMSLAVTLALFRHHVTDPLPLDF